MCMACDMFWMAPEEPMPAPKRRARKTAVGRTAAREGDAFVCEPPETVAQKPMKRRAAAPRRTPRVKSGRRP